MLTPDEPTCTPATPALVRAMELEAMRLYRERHPDGPAWQELHQQTRSDWIGFVEEARHITTTEGDAP